MHASVTGTAEYLAETDAHAIHVARQVMANLAAAPWQRPHADLSPRPFKPPRHDIDELLGLVPVDFKKPYDVREVIARLVDDSDFLEFKQLYGGATVCGHATLEGHACALIGNNGPINPDGATKAAQFIQLCCQSGTPIVYLQNTTGYMVGTAAEQAGMVKHGSKMIQAVANATVPQITLIIGGSFGAGNYGMCGRAYSPRFLWMWPNARISVMGGEQAADVLATVKDDQLARAGKSWTADERAAFRQPTLDKYEAEGNPYYATARLWDDGIIDPKDTRTVLGLSLSAAYNAPIPDWKPGVFRM